MLESMKTPATPCRPRWFQIKPAFVRNSGIPFWIAVSALSVGVIHSGCTAEPNGLTSRAREDFEWFSTLGFPDTRGCLYVRVATGDWSQSGDESPQNRFIKAFLLATNASTFRVLTLALLDRTFTPTN